MTLKGKNRYTFILSVFFSSISIFFLVYFLVKFNAILKSGTFSMSFPSLVTKNIWATVFAEMCMIAYIPIVSFYIYSHFLKTPSTEIIYFMLFLLGATIELFRITLPFEIEQNTFPRLLVFIGRALFLGRSLVFISLFVSAVAGEPEQRVNAEQNIFIVLVVSVTVSSIVPINTAELNFSALSKSAAPFSVETGLNSFAIFFYIICATATFLTYAIKSWQNENPDYLFLAMDIIFVETGLVTLNSSEILAAAIPGAIIIGAGTFRYLKRLHKLYM